MEINIWREPLHEDVTILAVKGEITAATYEQLQQRVEDEIKAGTRNLVLDLQEVPYISSSGLRAIHHIFTLLEEPDIKMRKGMAAGTWKSSHLKLAAPAHDVLGVLRMTGYDYFLEIYEDREQAIASF